mgnify:FL=1
MSRQGYVTARQRTRAARELAQLGRQQHNARRNRWLVAGMFALIWLITAVSISYERRYTAHDYVVGQKVTRDIYSEAPFEYINVRKTELKREQASRQVPFVYTVDPEVNTSSIATLNRLQDALVSLAQDADAAAERADEISAAELSTDPQVQRLLSKLDDKQLLPPLLSVFASGRKTETLIHLLRMVMIQGIATDDLEGTFHVGMTGEDEIFLVDPRARRSRRKISELASPASAARQVTQRFTKAYPETSQNVRSALQQLLQRVIRPNIDFDPDATEAARAQAAAEVEVVRESVQAGAPILRRGETVTADDLVKLRVHAEEVRTRRAEGGTLTDTLVDAGLVLASVIIFIYGLGLLMPRIYSSASTLAMIATIVVLQILISRLTMDLYYRHYGSSVFLYAIMPLAFGPMLLALLIDVRTAVWLGLFTALVAALQSYDSFTMFLSGATAAFAGAVFVQNASRRFHMLRAGLAVALATFFISALYVVDQDIPPRVIPQLFGFAVLNGIATAMVASTILPLLEYLFGVITNISLLELSDLNHPLLKKLQMEAPGTYHHSLLVATLAEQAATAIGANPLLARVCAYFHDIGKISQAEYFAENINLSSGSNPHDELQPRMSSLIILNHVKGGIELAAKYKLKRVVREAIAQHHGRSLISYFYNRAREKSKGNSNDQDAGKQNNVEQQNYRYPGPLPVRKEIVLISMADACEAAARSLEKPTPRKIEQLVDKIVYGRIQDGQFDRADLTFRELAAGKATIASALGNMLHARVAYDKQEETNDGNRSEKTDEQAAPEKSPDFVADTA